MKKAIVFIFAGLFAVNAMAQTVQEGVSNWYAERYQSAKSIFEKLTAANPNNLEAVYWLGQTHIAMGDVAGAKALYQRALSTNGNAPWVLVGMGHINLLEGKSAEARAQFEQAVTASVNKKKNDPAILTAVGRANVQPYTDDKKIGDLDYAIAKLNEALQLAPTNADAAVVLGNAWRKKHVGGEAVVSYRKAGNFAPALYRTAGIYISQQNWDAVLENLNSAVAADAKYAPAYEELYRYNLFQKQDLNAADNFGKLYVSNSDPSVENDYIIAQTCFVRKDYECAISTAEKILQQTNNSPKARVYRLLAYSYLEGRKDTVKSCDYANRFLARATATQDEILANDYLLHAKVCGHGNRAIVREDIMKALQIDTVRSRQYKVINDAIRAARAERDYPLEGELMLMSHSMRAATANPADLFYIGTIFYYGKDYAKSDSVLSVYTTAFPDTVQGYYWKALAKLAIDTAGTQGLAVPDLEKTLQLAETDKVRFKSQATQSAYLLAVYYNNVQNDRAKALTTANKGLEFEPENDLLKRLVAQLSGASKPAATTPKTEPKPKATTPAPKPKKTK